jgi:hypothetical protein
MRISNVTPHGRAASAGCDLLAQGQCRPCKDAVSQSTPLVMVHHTSHESDRNNNKRHQGTRGATIQRIEKKGERQGEAEMDRRESHCPAISSPLCPRRITVLCTTPSTTRTKKGPLSFSCLKAYHLTLDVLSRRWSGWTTESVLHKTQD